MASNLTLADLLQNADQLFDESKYQETLDVLNNFEVSRQICHATGNLKASYETQNPFLVGSVIR